MGKCFTLMCPNLNQCSQSNMVPPYKVYGPENIRSRPEIHGPESVRTFFGNYTVFRKDRVFQTVCFQGRILYHLLVFKHFRDHNFSYRDIIDTLSRAD